MKAVDAKQFIGKKVEYTKGLGIVRFGVVVKVEGRNIFLEDNVLWAPDIQWMTEVTTKEAP